MHLCVFKDLNGLLGKLSANFFIAAARLSMDLSPELFHVEPFGQPSLRLLIRLCKFRSGKFLECPKQGF